ncbi:MAG: hypothetical protein A2521_03950 [Deltaproteobacteria bacterium RIFOXYD12_FULL_57_12]|nr:MAG: hypothetical protein A2521_03950 [Deltaproteobacteria bacterium RIFOXYD12_FULL_57_12]
MVIVPWTFLPAGSAAAGSVSYAYDSLGRLTQAEYTNGTVISYAYDATGNRSNTTITGGGALMGNPANATINGAPALLASSMPALSLSSAPKTTGATATGEASAARSEQPPVAPLLLPTTIADPAVYGWNDRSVSPEGMVSAVFKGDGTDRLLHLQGYAIDTPDEVGLWLNGILLGYLSAAADDGTFLSTPSLWLLPAALQLPGENTVELAPRTEDQVWGVTRLGLYSLGSDLGSQEGATSGSLNPADSFELHLFSQGFSPGPSQAAGYLIELAGQDANSGEEIIIELNEAPLVELPQGDDQASEPVSQVRITDELLLPGDNRLLITSHGSTVPWGVRIDRLLPDDTTPADKPVGNEEQQ